MADIQKDDKGGKHSSNRSRTLEEIRGDRKKGFSSKSSDGKPKKKDNFWFSLLYAVLIALVIRSFFVEAFTIPTGSMKNTLLVGDYLFVNKLSYFFATPKYIPFTSIEIPHFAIPTWSVKHADVIVFEYPGDQDLVEPREKKVNYIKRCIGLPGDTIQVINKQVYVNGQPMPNPKDMVYSDAPWQKGVADPNIFPSGAPWNKDWFGPIRIPKKGDVIQLNKDDFSRWAVFIEREGHKVALDPLGSVDVDGKASSTYTVQRDYLWMMGDNRDQSEDSRFWGYAPVENVVGNALIIYWSRYNPPRTGHGDGYDPDEEQDAHFRWNRIGNLIH